MWPPESSEKPDWALSMAIFPPALLTATLPDSIHGDADLRTVNGSVTVSQGFRDVNLYNVGGLVSVAGVTGDIRLQGGLSDGDSLEARGDVVVRWPANVALNLAVTAPGSITVSLWTK